MRQLCCILVVLGAVSIGGLSSAISYGQTGINDKLDGELTVGGDVIVLETDDDYTRDLLLQQRLQLRTVDASVWDPSFLRLGAELDLGVTQSFVRGVEEISLGDLWGYDSYATFFPLSPIATNVFARRNQYYLARALTSRSEAELDSQGVIVSLRRLYIPSQLTYRREAHRLQHLAASGDRETLLDEDRRIFIYDGRRGWIDSVMNFHYERLNLENFLYPEMSYRSHEASAYFSTDLGPELNWRWDSRARLYSRDGVSSEFTTAGIDEIVRAKHAAGLQTEYRASAKHTRADEMTTSSLIGFVGARHRLYKSLASSFNADALAQQVVGGRKEALRSQAATAYTKRLPFDGKVLVGLAGGLQYEADEFEQGQSFVTYEEHEATSPIAVPIELLNKNVDESTIVIVKLEVSADELPAGCEPVSVPVQLEQGRDYVVQTNGSVTEIVPRPCSGASPGINPGDTISVDYGFTAPTMTFGTGTLNANLELDFPWARLYLSKEAVEQRLIEGGSDDFLDSIRVDRAGAELKWPGTIMRASAGTELSRSRSRSHGTKSVRGTQMLTVAVPPRFALSLTAEQSLLNYYDAVDCQRSLTWDCLLADEAPDRVLKAASGRLMMSVSSPRRFILESHVKAWWLVGLTSPEEHYAEHVYEGGARLRWGVRRLEAIVSTTYASRRRDGVGPDEFRMMLQIKRRLF